ncbi:MAG: hypothetical protein K2F77_00490, partial [Muribaculaceae bacterium]|nr:hypothetical protein [Muribaculaceae bacterium]
MTYIALPSTFIGANITTIPSDYGERSYTFTVSAMSGIVSVDASEESITAIELYDLTGRRLTVAPDK